MSIPININTWISSFNHSIVDLESNTDQQTEKVFLKINTKTDTSCYDALLCSYIEQIQLQRQTITYLKKELQNKQNIIEKLLDTVTGC